MFGFLKNDNNKERSHTQETKDKISKAMKKVWARRKRNSIKVNKSNGESSRIYREENRDFRTVTDMAREIGLE